jgi:hypothetical protein
MTHPIQAAANPVIRLPIGHTIGKNDPAIVLTRHALQESRKIGDVLQDAAKKGELRIGPGTIVFVEIDDDCIGIALHTIDGDVAIAQRQELFQPHGAAAKISDGTPRIDVRRHLLNPLLPALVEFGGSMPAVLPTPEKASHCVERPGESLEKGMHVGFP